MIEPEKTGLLAKSEKELLEQCLRLVDDKDLRRRMGSAGRERVRARFNHKDSLRKLSELYSR